MPVMRLALDSGAHSLFSEFIRKKGQSYQDGGQNWDYSYSDTEEFWAYVDRYAEFVKANKHLFDCYVNVDVIYNPEKSWVVQKYLEDHHKLQPMPVFHFGGDHKWLKKYMDNYEYIGLGGLGRGLTKQMYVKHADETFKILCDNRGYPLRKTHGFAITSLDLVWRYPFYTVDSSSWVHFSQFGFILVPHPTHGFCTKANEVDCSCKSPAIGKPTHYSSLPKASQERIQTYVESHGLQMGETRIRKVPAKTFTALGKTIRKYKLQGHERFMGAANKGENWRWLEERISRGVTNDHEQRDIINYFFYLEAQEALPKVRRIQQKDIAYSKMSAPSKQTTLFNRPDLLENRTGRPMRFDTFIYMGGNFDFHVYKHKEERMRQRVMDGGRDYNRMVSYYFHEKIGNIMEVKQEWMDSIKE